MKFFAATRKAEFAKKVFAEYGLDLEKCAEAGDINVLARAIAAKNGTAGPGASKTRIASTPAPVVATAPEVTGRDRMARAFRKETGGADAENRTADASFRRIYGNRRSK